MGKIIWRQAAIDDLENIYDYIARDAPLRAINFAEELTNQIKSLSDFPKIGKFQAIIKKEEMTAVESLSEGSLKNKYVQLLEKHAKILEELSELKEEVAVYRRKGK